MAWRRRGGSAFQPDRTVVREGGAAPAGVVRPRKKPVQHEQREQSTGVALLTQIGAKVYVLGTRRPRGSTCPKCRAFVPNPDQSTRQTPGISDVIAILPAREKALFRQVLFWEVKRADGEGRERKEQAEFRALISETATAHCLGSYDDLIAWLIEHRYINRNQVPHYRLPKSLQEAP